MKKFSEKAFTLVELLIVIGIIGILAVTLMVSLNPAEAQRKSRDAKRIKDATTIESILLQLINDGAVVTAIADVSSSAAGSVQSQSCAAASNWLATDVCSYAKMVPTDPQNNKSVTGVTGAATVGTVTAVYTATIESGEYEINVIQESKANAAKVTGDGGVDNSHFELFSGSSSTLLGT